MNPAIRTLSAAALAAGLLATTAAHAHGIWFAQRSTQMALIYGVGADDLDAVKRLPKVTSVAGYDAAGKAVPTKLQINGPLLLADIESKPAILTAVMDNGLWSKTPDGKWHNKGKDEVPGAVVSEWTWKYAVHIREPLSAPLAPLPDQTLQILPVKLPLPEKMGQPIKLRVLYQGKPAKGAKVLIDWINDPDGKPVKTAADGTVTIKVRNQGLNVIAAILEVPPEDKTKSNVVEHLATLSFVLPHQPE
jgi:uncharacterized GH25 family protein